MSEADRPDLATLTVQLLSAYVGNNAVPSSELAELIRTTRAALAEEEKPSATPEPEHVPAVSAKASLASRDHIISLIDGKPYKSLKRHLSTHGLTPAEYRDRYNLPISYPMVARAYSEQRRKVAKQLGLGRKKAEPEAVSEAVSVESTAAPKSTPKARATAAAKSAPSKSTRKKAAASEKAAQSGE